MPRQARLKVAGVGGWTEAAPRGYLAVPRNILVVTSIEVLLATSG